MLARRGLRVIHLREGCLSLALSSLGLARADMSCNLQRSMLISGSFLSFCARLPLQGSHRQVPRAGMHDHAVPAEGLREHRQGLRKEARHQGVLTDFGARFSSRALSRLCACACVGRGRGELIERLRETISRRCVAISFILDLENVLSPCVGNFGLSRIIAKC